MNRLKERLNQQEMDQIKTQTGLLVQVTKSLNGIIMEVSGMVNEKVQMIEGTKAVLEVIDLSKTQGNSLLILSNTTQIEAISPYRQADAKSLSGGQQQRIAIARLFLKNPPVIFLDEPTASLDAITTEQIKDSIEAIKKDRTVLIISHNISQIMDADHIYCMSEGELVAQGTHESLYTEGGLYRDIIDSNARSMNLGRLAATVLG